MTTRAIAASAALLVLGLTPANAGSSIVEFDPPGSLFTFISLGSIDKQGEITGGYEGSDGMVYGFIRSKNGSFKTFGTGDVDVQSKAIASGKLTTGDYNDGSGFVADAAGHITPFSAPGANGNGYGTQPSGINADGVAVGLFSLGTGDTVGHGFIRNPDGSFTTFDAPKAGTFEQTGTFVQAINDGGEIVGWTLDDDGVFHAFSRMPNGKMKLLRIPGAGKVSGQGSHAYCINKKGVVGGSYADVQGIAHGYLLGHKGAVTTVDIGGAAKILVSGVSDNGDATGSFSGADGISHGFVRSASGTIVTFDAPDAAQAAGRGTVAQSINAGGVITGYYWGTDNREHGFVRTP